MKEYIIKKVNENPDWSNIEVLNIDTPYLNTDVNLIKAYAQICYNDNELLVHLKTEEPETRAEEKGPDGHPWYDSCLEFFFKPLSTDDRYINIEFNSNACVFLGTGTNKDNNARLYPNSVEVTFNPKIKVFDGGWEIYYKVPMHLIKALFENFDAVSGKVMMANCYKCTDLTNPPHYLSWNEIVGEPFTFHKSECFGKMIFE